QLERWFDLARPACKWTEILPFHRPARSSPFSKEDPMRTWVVAPAVLIMIGLAASPLSASTLSENKQEASFSASYVDTSDVGKTTQADGQWQWIFSKGYHEIGALLSYLNFDPDNGSGSDATILGPVY